MARIASVPAPRTAYQPMEAVGVITEIDGDKQLEVVVLNVSPTGCSFRSPVPFRPGATHTLRIGTGPLYLASTLRIVASMDRNEGAGAFEVAAEFA